MKRHEDMLEQDNLLWTSEGRKRILALMDRARIAALHECSDYAAELSDCSGTFIACQIQDRAFEAANALNLEPQ